MKDPSSEKKEHDEGVAKMNQQPRPRDTTFREIVLTLLYVITTCLCLVMVIWILVLPSTWLLGWSARHTSMIETYILPKMEGLVPTEIVTKYEGHAAVQFTHTLPGAVWAGVLPFQLHPNFRKGHKRLHRYMGYAFVLSALLMSVGIVVMLQRGLLYDDSELNNDNNNNNSQRREYAIGCLTAWFAYTACRAVVEARAKRFASHRRFIIRHVGAGIWVSVQRVLILCASTQAPYSTKQQVALFGNCANYALIITILGSELAIWFLYS